MHLQYLKRFYPNFKGKKILDLGCGHGDFLLECHKEKIDITGVDVNLMHIKISEEKIKESGFEPNIILGSGEKLPFNNNYFDFINCTEVLEHTNNPEKVFNECYRVLKKDGYLFVTIPNRFAPKDPHYNILFLNWLPKKLRSRYAYTRKIERNPFHCPDNQGIDDMHYYTYKDFKNLVKKSGFSYIDTKKEQIKNPKLVINPKLKKIIYFLNCIKLNFFISFLYSFLINFYINSFHFLLKKK